MPKKDIGQMTPVDICVELSVNADFLKNYFANEESSEIDPEEGLELSQSLNTKKDLNTGYTALFQAATFHNSAKIVKALIEAGADKNLAIENSGVTAFHVAGVTALHVAVIANNDEMVKSLLNHGAAVDVCDNENKTPLHYAAKFGNREALNALIDAGANLNAQDIKGQTALHIAAKYNQIDVVRELIQRNPENRWSSTNENRTAFLLAYDKKYFDVCAALLSKDDEGVKNDQRYIEKIIKRDVRNISLSDEDFEAAAATRNTIYRTPEAAEAAGKLKKLLSKNPGNMLGELLSEIYTSLPSSSPAKTSTPRSSQSPNKSL